ncbi:MAG: sn-glycerol-1-phosphate dehydrogenase [Clostridiales bacterium]|nr:sn-glycerol-1-phosphate dehydrogenase [Clostridiales bacterium]
MNLDSIIKKLQNCPCGRRHTANIKAVEVGSGLLATTGEILKSNGFPSDILVVADKNTLTASSGILENLTASGFTYKLKLYDDLRIADIVQVNEIVELSTGTKGILSVGSGSLNDICRLAALKADCDFAIFATAPSMDGFASGTSPITHDNFKTTMKAREPSIIIADTQILAKAPAILKSAGFGDLVAKYIALADWRISHILTGEYYCEAIASFVRETVNGVVSQAGKITQDDEESAGSLMEALVFSGVAMKLADSVRPASGSEHIISHFWEIKKLENGQLSDFHGRKVGVATLLTADIYHQAILHEDVLPVREILDYDELLSAYGKSFIDEVRKLNTPNVTEETTPQIIKENWQNIREIIKSEIPPVDKLRQSMKLAGAPTTIAEIDVSPELGALGVRYSPYMRHRMTLLRILPLLGIDMPVAKLN